MHFSDLFNIHFKIFTDIPYSLLLLPFISEQFQHRLLNNSDVFEGSYGIKFTHQQTLSLAGFGMLRNVMARMLEENIIAKKEQHSVLLAGYSASRLSSLSAARPFLAGRSPNERGLYSQATGMQETVEI